MLLGMVLHFLKTEKNVDENNKIIFLGYRQCV